MLKFKELAEKIHERLVINHKQDLDYGPAFESALWGDQVSANMISSSIGLFSNVMIEEFLNHINPQNSYTWAKVFYDTRLDVFSTIRYMSSSRELSVTVQPDSDKSLEYGDIVSLDKAKDRPQLIFNIHMQGIMHLIFDYIKKYLKKSSDKKEQAPSSTIQIGDKVRQSPSKMVLWPTINKSGEQWKLSEEWKQIPVEMIGHKDTIARQLIESVEQHNNTGVGGGLYQNYFVRRKAMLDKTAQVQVTVESKAKMFMSTYFNPSKKQYTPEQIKKILSNKLEFDEWIRQENFHMWSSDFKFFWDNYKDKFEYFAISGNRQEIYETISGSDILIRVIDMAAYTDIIFKTDSDSSLAVVEHISHGDEYNISDFDFMSNIFKECSSELVYEYIMKHLVNSGQSISNQTTSPAINNSDKSNSSIPVEPKKNPVDPMQRLIDQLNQERSITNKSIDDFRRKYKAEIVIKLVKIANRLDELELKELSDIIDDKLL